MTPDLPQTPALRAPAGWQAVDCISDLHLRATDPAGLDALQELLRDTTADAVMILGDLFEVWVGDDAMLEPDAFERRCVQALHEATRHKPIYVMHGNRDFLLGEAFHAAAGTSALADPTTLLLGRQRFLLSHGDALCLSDVDYLAFRSLARGAVWQADFLARPLTDRRVLAREMRERSEAGRRSLAPARAGAQVTPDPPTNASVGARAEVAVPAEPAHPFFAEVDAAAALGWLRRAHAQTLVHGHTHRPADHALDGDARRWVLSDWDLAAHPPRADALCLRADGSVERRVFQPRAALSCD